ncbi:MAG: hypothetical protein ABJE95_05010 [Byssovorax sp.]
MTKRATLAAALLGASLVAAAPDSPAPPPRPARLLRTLAHDPGGYNPERVNVVTDLLLGDFLFHSPSTLGPKAQKLGISCNACHPNGATDPRFVLPGEKPAHPGSVDVTTGLFRPEAEDGRANPVNIPSLRGVRFTGPYGHDGRTASLHDFTQSVVVNEFDGAPLGWGELSALVHYLQDFDFLPTGKLDAQSRITAAAGPAAARGEAEFNQPRKGFGGQACSSCHVTSSFFRDGKAHRLPTGDGASPRGFEAGFETPTLLGTLESAPYFHDGRFPALADVVAWFDTTYALGLTKGARADLIAYLEAVGSADSPDDRRPLAQALDATFVYLELLAAGSVKDDRRVWTSVTALCVEALDGAPRRPDSEARRLRDRKSLIDLDGRARAAASLDGLREDARLLHRELTRYGADLQGAIAAEKR